jgi:hypothetical protein
MQNQYIHKKVDIQMYFFLIKSFFRTIPIVLEYWEESVRSSPKD